MTEQQEQQEQLEAVAPDDASEAEQAAAEELAEMTEDDADVLAGIVGDEFGLEMISPWGDRWIWVKIDAEKAQEIYKLLGQPVTFQRVGTGDGVGPQQDGPAGGEASAE